MSEQDLDINIEEPQTEESNPKKEGSSGGAVRMLRAFDISNYLSTDKILKQLPFLFFLLAIALFYIWNRHTAIHNVRELDRAEKTLNALKWNHVSLKSELDQQSKSSAVASLVEELGLSEITSPPIRLEE